MNNQYVSLPKLHKTLLKSFTDFDKFCKAHDIKYFVFAGSLIGTLLYKNFIPWDDDIDIAMDRENANKLLALASQLPDGYRLNDLATKSNADLILKWEYLNATIVETWSEKVKWVCGPFIDISIIDKIPLKPKKLDYVFWKTTLLLVHIKYKRLIFKGYKTNYDLNFLTMLLYKVSFMIAKIGSIFVPANFFKKMFLKKLKKWDKLTTNYQYATFSSPQWGIFPEWTFSQSMIEEEYIYGDFATLKVPMIKQSKKILFDMYGEQVLIKPKKPLPHKSHIIFFDDKIPFSEYKNDKVKKQELKKIIKDFYKTK